MRNFCFLFFLATCITAISAHSVSVPRVRMAIRKGELSGTVTTRGIVTGKYQDEKLGSGFYLQDKFGDGDFNTSDAIFVYAPTALVSVGDEIEIVATTAQDKALALYLKNAENLRIISRNNTLAPVKIRYDKSNPTLMNYLNMLVEFDQTLWVNNNYHFERYGDLELGISRKPIPTQLALPASAEYVALVNENALPVIVLSDGDSSASTQSHVFADENGTRRTGERILGLQGILDYKDGKYVIIPSQTPVSFFGNPRKEMPDNIGNCDLRVCGFNLEYYLTAPNSDPGSTIGPSNYDEVNKQHVKLLDAMLAIDADIYGLVEIEQGQDALSKMAKAMNAAKGLDNIYTYVNDGTKINGTFTKAAYLYRSDKVRPYRALTKVVAPTTPLYRRNLQGFTFLPTGERFMFSVNHFKSKSGCKKATGEDADQGDGQSCFNATRVREAKTVITSIDAKKTYYDTDAVLIMGDLNAYAKEDPVTAFVKAGYTDLLRHFHVDSAYSYVYRSEAGYLDHALANDALLPKVTGVTAFHINADEPAMFGYDGRYYQPNMFRSSDHDPIIVGLNFGTQSSDSIIEQEKISIYYSEKDNVLRIRDAERYYLQLYSMSGIRLYQKQITSNAFELDVKNSLNVLPGVYFVRVLGEGRIVYRLILVG